MDSRFLKEACHAAAHQQEELLREEDPGDLLQRGLRLAPQVQDGGAEEGDAQPEAEEDAPVGERLLQVVLEERADALVQRRHGALAPPEREQERPHGRALLMSSVPGSDPCRYGR